MWCIEYDPASHLLAIRVTRQAPAGEMRALMRAHVQALAATGGASFRVLTDLRGLMPLDAESAQLFSDIKRAAQSLPGFTSRVVLCDSATVAMQQRRTSLQDQTAEQELITFDETEARRQLQLEAR
ncbi:MAG: hypothetical protein U0234_07855 [Sandaracinus sp.]